MGSGTLGQYRSSTVRRGWSSRGHDHVSHSVESPGGVGHVRELGRRLARDGPSGSQGLADGTELTPTRRVSIPHTGLQDRGRQDIPPV